MMPDDAIVFQVTARTHGHEFPIGTLVQAEPTRAGLRCWDMRGVVWYCDVSEVKAVTGAARDVVTLYRGR